MSEQNRIMSEYRAALDAGEGVIEVGRTVVCDGCDTDLTDDPRTGGFLFGTYAFGPCCADARLTRIYELSEQLDITSFCPAGETFADWIRLLRKRSGNNKIIITSLRPTSTE